MISLQDDLDSLVNSPSSFSEKVGPAQTLVSGFAVTFIIAHMRKQNLMGDCVFFRLEREEPSSPKQTLMQERMLQL